MSSILFIDAGGGLVVKSPVSILYIIIKIEICNRAFYGPTKLNMITDNPRL